MPEQNPHIVAAFVAGLSVATLGGLIGLGGAEFRLPLLISLFGCAARQAVPLNLLVSLVTVAVAVAARLALLPQVMATLPLVETAAIAGGAVVAAWLGAGLLAKMRDAQLHAVIGGLLLCIAALLALEAVLPAGLTFGLPDDPWLRAAVAVPFGLAIGMVSSLLGVAGGELIIPTLLFVFAVDIRTAGTASLLISLPTVAIGLVRYRRLGAFRDRVPLIRLALPMAAGSVLGALLGAALAGIVSATLLKAILAVVLTVSAVKLLRHGR